VRNAEKPLSVTESYYIRALAQKARRFLETGEFLTHPRREGKESIHAKWPFRRSFGGDGEARPGLAGALLIGKKTLEPWPCRIELGPV